jgi:hypothetical protein
MLDFLSHSVSDSAWIHGHDALQRNARIQPDLPSPIQILRDKLTQDCKMRCGEAFKHALCKAEGLQRGWNIFDYFHWSGRGLQPRSPRHSAHWFDFQQEMDLFGLWSALWLILQHLQSTWACLSQLHAPLNISVLAQKELLIFVYSLYWI